MAQKKEDREEDMFAALAKTFHEANKEIVTYYGKDVRKMDPEGFIPTPLTLLNIFTGGGIPRGRITEIFGGAADGKSALLFYIYKYFHETFSGKVLHFDSETSTSIDFADLLGLDTSRAWMGIRAVTVEDVFTCMDKALVHMEKATCPLLVGWDSIAATPTRKSLTDEDYSDGNTYETARVISRCLRKFGYSIGKTGATVVVVNQTRTKVEHNAWKAKFMQEDEKTVATGGKAREFAMSLGIQFLRKGKINAVKGQRKAEAIGFRGRINLAKSRLGRSYVSFPYAFYMVPHDGHVVGFDDNESIMMYLLEQGVAKEGEKTVDKKKVKYFRVTDPTDGTVIEDSGMQAMTAAMRAEPPLRARMQEITRVVAMGLDMKGAELVEESDAISDPSEAPSNGEATVSDDE